MTQGLKEGEPNGRDVYPDIIDHTHWVSPSRPQMSLYDRAAQFSSYKALSGYEDMVAEETRLTDCEVELGEHEFDVLNQKLALIADVIAGGSSPVLTFTVFFPDATKSGGEYRQIEEEVKKIDVIGRKIVLSRKRELSGINESIAFDRIVDIQGDLVDYIT